MAGISETGRWVRTPAAAEHAGRILVLEVHPDLGAHIDPEHWDTARTAISAPVAKLDAGPWSPEETLAGGQRAFAVLVVEGLLARTVDIGNHPGLELYGPGDVIGSSSLAGSVLPAGESWVATVPARVAVLDDEFLVASRRWPRLLTGVVEQMQHQRDRLVLQLVIAEQPRVEDRLVALFWLLSERYGHVSSDGVVIGLKLTHEALGRLIGAQRPTVTLALKALRTGGALERLPDGRWLLAQQPDDAVVAAAQLPVSHHPVPVGVERAIHARAVAKEQRLAAATQRDGARAMRHEAAEMKRAAEAALGARRKLS
jgi:CRP/FNR family cyclic AMP-dependent transcriptional regulator